MNTRTQKSPFWHGFDLPAHLETIRQSYQQWRGPLLSLGIAAIVFYGVMIPLGFYDGLWQGWATWFNTIAAKVAADKGAPAPMPITSWQLAFSAASSLLTLVGCFTVFCLVRNMFSLVGRFTSAWRYFFRSLRIGLTLVGITFVIVCIAGPICLGLKSMATLTGGFLLAYILASFLFLLGGALCIYLFVYALSVMTFGSFRAYEGGEPAAAYRDGWHLFKQHWSFFGGFYVLAVLLLAVNVLALHLVLKLAGVASTKVVFEVVWGLISKPFGHLVFLLHVHYYFSIRTQLADNSSEE